MNRALTALATIVVFTGGALALAQSDIFDPGAIAVHEREQLIDAKQQSAAPRQKRASRTPPSRHFSRSRANSSDDICSPPSSSRIVRLFSAAAGIRPPVSGSSEIFCAQVTRFI